jgi:hypothetical protein
MPHRLPGKKGIKFEIDLMNISKYFLPILVAFLLFGGYHTRRLFTQPTTTLTYEQHSGGAKLVCIVEGLKCKGTANFFTGLFKDTPGILKIETYATEHKAVFQYNPKEISPADIKLIMEQMVMLRDGSSIQVFKCISLE